MHTSPQIKICGLTRPSEARACVAAGANAIGLVFYPPSPRNVDHKQAEDIVDAIAGRAAAVGVFVNPELQDLVETVHRCGLTTVQLHGTETPQFVRDFSRQCDALVVKGLFSDKPPHFSQAEHYAVSGFLVECGQGMLPGGNAMQWNWRLAKPLGQHYPMALAGGLNPQTVSGAIAASLPDAVDASSGLERAPGRKDLNKVAAFIDQVHRSGEHYRKADKSIRPVF